MPEDTGTPTGEGKDGGTPIDFEKWLSEQAEDVRTGYETHTANLKSALQKEREANKKRQTEDAAKQREADEAERKRLEEQGEYQKVAEKATSLADKERARAEAAEERANGLLLRFEFSAAVKRQKLAFADATAEADAYFLTDLTDVAIKDGVVEKDKMDNAVQALIKARPYLLKQAQPQSIDAGAGVGPGGKTPEQEATYQETLKQKYRL